MLLRKRGERRKKRAIRQQLEHQHLEKGTIGSDCMEILCQTGDREGAENKAPKTLLHSRVPMKGATKTKPEIKSGGEGDGEDGKGKKKREIRRRKRQKTKPLGSKAGK